MRLGVIAFIFFILFSTIATKATTRIAAKDKNYADIEIRIYAYENLLTHQPKLLKTTRFSAHGILDINLSIAEPQLVYIPLYSFHLIFYAEPNKALKLKLPPLKELKAAFEKHKTYYAREIPLFIKGDSILNEAIANYDVKYNDFLKQNFQKLYLKKNEKKHLLEAENLNVLHTSIYLKNYRKYKKAYIDYVAGFREALLQKHFANEKPLLHNTAYVSLLKKIAAPMATDFPYQPSHKRLYKKMLAATDYKKLSDIYKGFANTDDTVFNEHFFIYVLYMGMRKKTITPTIALEKLQIIAKASKSKENKKLSSSILMQKKLSFSGNMPAQFSLKATNNKIYTQEVFKSTKPTLLACLDSSINNSETIATLKALQEKHKDNFTIIVWASEKPIKEIPSKWLQFTLPYHSYILRDYRLGRFPYYLLIAKDGKISKQTWQQYLISLEH